MSVELVTDDDSVIIYGREWRRFPGHCRWSRTMSATASPVVVVCNQDQGSIAHHEEMRDRSLPT